MLAVHKYDRVILWVNLCLHLFLLLFMPPVLQYKGALWMYLAFNPKALSIRLHLAPAFSGAR